MTIKTTETIEHYNEEGKLIEKTVRETTEEKADVPNYPTYPYYPNWWDYPNWWNNIKYGTSTPTKIDDYVTSATETSTSGAHTNLTKHNIVEGH